MIEEPNDSQTAARKSAMELRHLPEADFLAPGDFPMASGQLGLHGRIILGCQMLQIRGKKKPFFG